MDKLGLYNTAIDVVWGTLPSNCLTIAASSPAPAQ